MKESELKAFGIIFEDQEGQLHFNNFNIVCGDRFRDARSDIVLLTLVKERIEKEISLIEGS